MFKNEGIERIYVEYRPGEIKRVSGIPNEHLRRKLFWAGCDVLTCKNFDFGIMFYALHTHLTPDSRIPFEHCYNIMRSHLPLLSVIKFILLFKIALLSNCSPDADASWISNHLISAELTGDLNKMVALQRLLEPYGICGAYWKNCSGA